MNACVECMASMVKDASHADSTQHECVRAMRHDAHVLIQQCNSIGSNSNGVDSEEICANVVQSAYSLAKHAKALLAIIQQTQH